MKLLYRSISFGWKLYIRTYVFEISNETPQKKCRKFEWLFILIFIFFKIHSVDIVGWMKPCWHPKRNSHIYLNGRKFEWLFIFIFFIVENEKIVLFMLFRPKSYSLGWFETKPRWNPKWNAAISVLEGPQIWMTIYFYFFS
jgi:hypothetical protein